MCAPNPAASHPSLNHIYGRNITNPFSSRLRLDAVIVLTATDDAASASGSSDLGTARIPHPARHLLVDDTHAPFRIPLPYLRLSGRESSTAARKRDYPLARFSRLLRLPFSSLCQSLSIPNQRSSGHIAGAPSSSHPCGLPSRAAPSSTGASSIPTGYDPVLYAIFLRR